MNMKGKKIACIGELLIDFVCTDIDQGLVQGQHFLKKAGGAPANVAVTIARCGGQAKLAAQIGNDPFGEFLKQTLAKEQLDLSAIIRDPNLPTTLAFVGIQHDGERDFVFCRGADGSLTLENIPLDYFDDVGLLHLGAATGLLDAPFYDTYLSMAQQAKVLNIVLSFDPNFRDGFWQGQESLFIQRCQPLLQIADIIKMSEEELVLISKESDIEKGCFYLHQRGVKWIAITLGSRGTWVSHASGLHCNIPSIEVQSIDSTGAGDAFIGALLYKIIEHNKWPPTYANFIEYVRYANKVGALTCTKFGAIDGIPYRHQVNGF